ncbi:MAG: helix-turn-helix domain-containing protein [Zavarzinella sp.]
MENLPFLANSDYPGSLPTVTVVEICDPTAIGENIELIELDAVQLESRPLRARRVIVRLGAITVIYHSTNCSVRTRTRLLPGFMAYVAFGPSAAGTLNGSPVGPDRMLACMPNIEVEFVVAAGYESVAFLLPPDEMQSQLNSWHQEADFHLPHGVELLTPCPAAAHGLYSFGRRLTDLAARQPELFDQNETRSAAKVELLETLMMTIGSALQVTPPLQDRTRQVYSRVVQVAEDYVLAHNSDRLYVADLCEVTGVSERTLQYAFKELMGMTPVAYLTRLRLHRVRQALRAANQNLTTVTTEALKWGFWHFGDFSHAYKTCFGELPSETLRRDPGESPPAPKYVKE